MQHRPQQPLGSLMSRGPADDLTQHRQSKYLASVRLALRTRNGTKQITWKMKQKMMPMPAKRQNQRRAGMTVEEPMRKARASVAEVIRMEIAPPFIAAAVRSSMDASLPSVVVARTNSLVSTKASSMPAV